MAHHDSRQKIAGPTIPPTQRESGHLVGWAVFAIALYGLSAALCGGPIMAIVFWCALGWFVFPGWLIAGRWFSGPDRILIGALLGFFLSSLATTGVVGLAQFGYIAWLVPAPVSVIAWLVQRAIRPAMPPHAPSSVDAEQTASRASDAWWLLASMVVAVVVVGWPFVRVGSLVDGGIAYRAYFSADLMTHLSVIAEIQKGEFPLADPFFSNPDGSVLSYYWLFFTFPALVGNWSGLSNQGALLATNLAGCLLFTGLLYRLLRRIGTPPRLACTVVVLGLGMVSFEGPLAALASSIGRLPRVDLTNINIDAVGRWLFELSSLDGLHRSLLYTPQHLFSYSSLLVLMSLVERGEPATVPTSLLAGLLLATMAGTSIVTAMIAGPWLAAVMVWRLRAKTLPFARWLLCCAAVGSISLGCLAWFGWLGFFGGAASSLTWRWPSLLELPSWLALDLGGLSILALWCFFRARSTGRVWAPTGELRGALPFLGLLAIVCALFVDLQGYEGVWMVWRAGSVLTIALLVGVAFALRQAGSRWMLVAVAPALLTTAVDLFNAQDIHNRRLSAGNFPWTTVVPRDEWDALLWVREQTSEEAIVQWDVRARDDGQWALIPAIGERRMAVGFPIFLLEVTKYRARERRHVRRIFTSADVVEAHSLAVRAGIDYLIVGPTELAVRGERVRALWADDRRFHIVFTAGQTTVLRVVS